MSAAAKINNKKVERVERVMLKGWARSGSAVAVENLVASVLRTFHCAELRVTRKFSSVIDIRAIRKAVTFHERGTQGPGSTCGWKARSLAHVGEPREDHEDH
ncbi:unnamed protein product [Plutella xylostella]|uniref:(diamondback moth) hypothetical protein n=1 Tax=Plutella xylostella TaxID=51655 RepID=A0A8S4G4J9_PLUXY|nr:unnamed protein product [Plutella xylostella]